MLSRGGPPMHGTLAPPPSTTTAHVLVLLVLSVAFHIVTTACPSIFILSLKNLCSHWHCQPWCCLCFSNALACRLSLAVECLSTLDSWNLHLCATALLGFPKGGNSPLVNEESATFCRHGWFTVHYFGAECSSLFCCYVFLYA